MGKRGERKMGGVLGWCLILAVLGVRAGGINGGIFFSFLFQDSRS